jgi:hypothetical protein
MRVKGGLRIRLTSPPFVSRLSRKFASLDVSPGPVAGIVLLFSPFGYISYYNSY